MIANSGCTKASAESPAESLAAAAMASGSPSRCSRSRRPGPEAPEGPAPVIETMAALTPALIRAAVSSRPALSRAYAAAAEAAGHQVVVVHLVPPFPSTCSRPSTLSRNNFQDPLKSASVARPDGASR